LFPEFPSFSELGGVLSLSLMVWTSARFGIHAFGLDNVRYRYSYNAAAWIGSLALLAGLARLSGLEPASSIFLFILALLVCILNCFCSYRFLKSAGPSAKFYFLGIWFMTACVVLVLARNFGFIPAYQFIDYVWQSNLIVHATLISLGMVMTQREAIEERRRATDFRSRAESNLKYGILQKQMIALVSHEFRNSLAMLNALMHTVNKRKDLPSEVVVRHQNMVRVHQQMRRMIDNFLLGERIENADIKISGRQTDVGTLIQEVISFAELESKQYVILVDACDLPELVWLDDGILRLTLTNLLDNAIKYSPAGSKIILNGWYANGLLHMSVSDNGIGMSADTLSRMFEPHFKADLQSAGLGIGLSMVRMMLRAHGGDMRVTSAIGDGTTLNFWLKTKSSSDADVFQLAAGPVS
jgi:signal transduction histidine kinase